MKNKIPEQKKKYMRQWKIDHGSEKINAVEEVRKLKIKCCKCGFRNSVAFINTRPLCRRCFNIVRPPKKKNKTRMNGRLSKC